MRIYIIGNDGITLCREPAATVNKGEVAVAAREELHAARLSGKRLLALWNALPGVEKQTKVGDPATVPVVWTASGENKLKVGSRLLVSPFPEIKFILSWCRALWSLWAAAVLWARRARRRAFSPGCP